MLLLVGLGLGTKDISLAALEEIKKAKVILLENYTTFLEKEYIDFLKEELGREIPFIDRPELEEGAKKTLEAAKDGTLAILVPGDPLIATTHYATLVSTAHKLGIKVRTYHSSSIYSAAVGESGLDVYRFGPPVTIPFWSKNYKPTSFFDNLKKNLDNNQHTMLLLDLNQKEKKPMSLQEALELLKNAEAQRKHGIMKDSLKVVAMGNVGKKDSIVVYSSIADLEKVFSKFNKKTLTIIVPSNPSFAELEALQAL